MATSQWVKSLQHWVLSSSSCGGRCSGVGPHLPILQAGWVVNVSWVVTCSGGTESKNSYQMCFRSMFSFFLVDSWMFNSILTCSMKIFSAPVIKNMKDSDSSLFALRKDWRRVYASSQVVPSTRSKSCRKRQSCSVSCLMSFQKWLSVRHPHFKNDSQPTQKTSKSSFLPVRNTEKCLCCLAKSVRVLGCKVTFPTSEALWSVNTDLMPGLEWITYFKDGNWNFLICWCRLCICYRKKGISNF